MSNLRTIAAGMLGGVLGVMLLGTVWDSAWESRPAGTQLASDLDTFIQEFKVQLSDRLETEMHFGTLTSTDDNGLMFLGSARCFYSASAPTTLGNTHGGYDGSSHVANTLATTAPNGTGEQGRGRCWIDIDGPDGTAGTPDDYSVAYWNDSVSGGWIYEGSVNDSLATGSQRFMFDPGKRNLVYNGGFEAGDGSGNDSSTTVPAGWTLSATPTIAYATPPTTELEGLEVVVTAAGATDEGISQTLTNLRPSTLYFVRTRAQPGVAADSCTIRTTGATDNLSATIASGTDYVTLSGTFLTDATPTAVVLIAEADADGDICSFDGVAVFETTTDRRGTGYQGAWKVSATGDAAADQTCGAAYDAGACDDLVSVTVEIPGPGHLVVLSASATLGGDCSYRLHDETNGTQLVEQHQDLSSTELENGVVLNFTVVNPTPGEVVYDFDALNTNCDYEGNTHGPAYLEAVIIPVG